MKRPSAYVRTANDTDMNATMTPMIDVVFLLLVFFVWTASFQIIESVLPSEMSTQMGSDPVENDEPPPPEEDFDDVVVKISWNGQSPVWSINETPVANLDGVSARLRAIAEVKTDAPLILRPEGQVPLGYVIETYDAAKLVGFQEISFAVNMAAQASQ